MSTTGNDPILNTAEKAQYNAVTLFIDNNGLCAADAAIHLLECGHALSTNVFLKVLQREPEIMAELCSAANATEFARIMTGGFSSTAKTGTDRLVPATWNPYGVSAYDRSTRKKNTYSVTNNNAGGSALIQGIMQYQEGGEPGKPGTQHPLANKITADFLDALYTQGGGNTNTSHLFKHVAWDICNLNAEITGELIDLAEIAGTGNDAYTFLLKGVSGPPRIKFAAQKPGGNGQVTDAYRALPSSALLVTADNNHDDLYRKLWDATFDPQSFIGADGSNYSLKSVQEFYLKFKDKKDPVALAKLQNITVTMKDGTKFPLMSGVQADILMEEIIDDLDVLPDPYETENETVSNLDNFHFAFYGVGETPFGFNGSEFEGLGEEGPGGARKGFGLDILAKFKLTDGEHLTFNVGGSYQQTSDIYGLSVRQSNISTGITWRIGASSRIAPTAAIGWRSYKPEGGNSQGTPFVSLDVPIKIVVDKFHIGLGGFYNFKTPTPTSRSYTNDLGLDAPGTPSTSSYSENVELNSTYDIYNQARNYWSQTNGNGDMRDEDIYNAITAKQNAMFDDQPFGTVTATGTQTTQSMMTMHNETKSWDQGSVSPLNSRFGLNFSAEYFVGEGNLSFFAKATVGFGSTGVSNFKDIEYTNTSTVTSYDPSMTIDGSQFMVDLGGDLGVTEILPDDYYTYGSNKQPEITHNEDINDRPVSDALKNDFMTGQLIFGLRLNF
ncbi:MAG: hypothetical protein ACTSXQ_01655 [Alphaproteobacteria bacterium]